MATCRLPLFRNPTLRDLRALWQTVAGQGKARDSKTEGVDPRFIFDDGFVLECLRVFGLIFKQIIDRHFPLWAVVMPIFS